MARNGTKTGGRKKGTPNKKTTELMELLGDYNPIQRLIEIAKDENTSLDMQVKINLDLLPYIYPKRKSIDMNSNEIPEVKIYINHENKCTFICTFRAFLSKFYAIKKRVEIQSSSLFGCGGTRTHDQLIKSQLRYQLRHAPIYI